MRTVCAYKCALQEKIKEIMRHVMSAIKGKIDDRMGIFDFLGLDFFIDDNFNVWSVPGVCAWGLCLGSVPGVSAWSLCLGSVPGCGPAVVRPCGLCLGLCLGAVVRLCLGAVLLSCDCATVRPCYLSQV